FQALRTPGVGEKMIMEQNMFVEQMLPGAVIRKLSDEEMDRYGDVVFEATKRYGMALREVNTIATFVATNSLRSRKGIEEWSDALAALQVFTKSNEDTVTSFGDIAINLLQLSGKEAKKFGFALGAVGKISRMAFGEVVDRLETHKDLIAEAVGNEKKMAVMVAISASKLKLLGLNTAEADEFIKSIATRTTKWGGNIADLYQRDLPAAIDKVIQYTKELEITDKNIKDVSEHHGVSLVTFSKVRRAISQNIRGWDKFNKVMDTSTQDIIDHMRETEGLGDLWDRVWGKVQAVFTSWGSGVAKWLDGPLRRLGSWLDDTLTKLSDAKKWGDAVNVMKNAWKEVSNWWKDEFYPGIKDDWNDLKKWLKETALPAMGDIIIDLLGPIGEKAGEALFKGMENWAARGGKHVVGGAAEAIFPGITRGTALEPKYIRQEREGKREVKEMKEKLRAAQPPPRTVKQIVAESKEWMA
ncbi:hypothetical protein LCGC14_2586610, partial [marine sediment metagenome]